MFSDSKYTLIAKTIMGCLLFVLISSIIQIDVSMAQPINKNFTEISWLTEPIDYSLGLITTLDNLIPNLKGVWLISNLESSIRESLIASTGIRKMRTGIPTPTAYSEYAINKTYPSFEDIKTSWSSIKSANRDLSTNPERALEDIKSALNYGTKAYIDVLSTLLINLQYADRIGLDEYAYSGYSANLRNTTLSKLLTESKEANKIGKEYNENRLKQIFNTTESIRSSLENVTLIVNGNAAEKISAITSIVNIIRKVFGLLDLSGYYNTMFGPSGVYIKVFKINTELEYEIKLMFNDFNSLVADYNTIILKRPDIKISTRDVSDIIQVYTDPAALVLEGDKLQREAEANFKEAKVLVDYKIGDNFLFKAISKLRTAISEKRLASNKYIEAKKVETEIEDKIDRICASKLNSKTRLSMLYYRDGKEKCKSSDYLVRIEGAREIKWANSGLDKNLLLEEVSDQISILKGMINRAEDDKIDVTIEKTKLAEIEDELGTLTNMDTDTAINTLLRMKEELKQLENQIVIKAQSKVSNILKYRSELQSTGDKFDDIYSNFFDGDSLNISAALGYLSEMEEYYKELLKKTNLSIKEMLYANVNSSFCNKKMNVNMQLELQNPNQMNISKTISVNGKTININLKPGEITHIEMSKDIVLTACRLENLSKSGNKTLSLLTVSLAIPVKHAIKVYLDQTVGKIISGPNIHRDRYGYYIYPTTGNETLLIEAGGDPSTKHDIEIPYETEVNNSYEHKDPTNAIKEIENWQETKSNGTANEENLTAKELGEYQKLLDILTKNKNCTVLDIEWLKSKPTLEKLKLMTKEYLSLRRQGILAGNKLVNNGESLDEIKGLLHSNQYCKLIKLSNAHKPKKSVVTGDMYNFNYSGILPLAAIVLVVYLSMKGKKEKENKLKKILQSIEE